MTDELHGVYLESAQAKGLEERKTGLGAFQDQCRSFVNTYTVYLHFMCSICINFHMFIHIFVIDKFYIFLKIIK